MDVKRKSRAIWFRVYGEIQLHPEGGDCPVAESDNTCFYLEDECVFRMHPSDLLARNTMLYPVSGIPTLSSEELAHNSLIIFYGYQDIRILSFGKKLGFSGIKLILGNYVYLCYQKERYDSFTTSLFLRSRMLSLLYTTSNNISRSSRMKIATLKSISRI